MALKKEIELENGIILNYHRIVSINKITNNQNIIEVASYINETQREKEKEAIEKGEPFDVFIYSQYFNQEYDAEENIQDAYDYLKTLDEFKDAEDA